jgi:AcrR family transcriptional regulator
MPPKKHIDLNRVVQTAITLANENGFESVSLASIAEQLGIRIPSLYNHVAGLPGLRYQMSLWAVRQLTDQARRAAVGKSGDEAIFSIAAAFRAFAHANPGVYRSTLRAPSPDESELSAAAQELLDIVLAVLQPYGFGTEDTLHAVRGLRSTLHGFIDLETVGGFGMPLDCDESFRQLMEAFVRGLHVRRDGVTVEQTVYK